MRFHRVVLIALAVVCLPTLASADRPFELSLRGGVTLPRTKVQFGPAAALDISYRLPLVELDERLRIFLSVGYDSLSFRGEELVPLRGVDPNFIQNSMRIPTELGLGYRVVNHELDLWLGGGLGMAFVRSEFIAFSAPSYDQALAFSAFGFLRLTRELGPGSILADFRYAESRADVGQLGQAGTGNLSGFTLTLGYTFAL